MNSFDYHDIFGNNLVPVKEELMAYNLVFIQDNDSICQSVLIPDCLSSKNIKTLDIPSKNLDINPTENMWGISVRHVYDLTCKNLAKSFS